MSATKAELHAIVDRLCEEYAEDVLVLVRNYLDEDETLTPEEAADMDAGLAEIAAGDFVDLDDLLREFGLELPT